MMNRDSGWRAILPARNPKWSPTTAPPRAAATTVVAFISPLAMNVPAMTIDRLAGTGTPTQPSAVIRARNHGPSDTTSPRI